VAEIQIYMLFGGGNSKYICLLVAEIQIYMSFGGGNSNI